VPAVRTALIGYGLGGRVIHRPLLQAVPAIALTHVVTADPERRAQASSDVPEAALLPTVQALWSRAEEFDAVVVVTANDAHVPLATAAVDLGKAVVVDKPLATTSHDAARLVAHAAAVGVPLTAFHNRRWDSDTLTARALLEGGVLGTVHRMESRFTRFRPTVADRWRERAGGGGVLLDLGTHLVDQAVHLLGRVTAVHAEVAARRPGAVVDDDVVLSLRHESGAASMLWCSAAAPWTGPRLVLQGSAAGWVKQELDGQEAAQRDGVALPPEPPGALWDERGPRAVASLQGDWAAFYRAFAASVLEGAAVPVHPAAAVAVLRVLEAAQRSAARGEVVALS
jgi:scyllo-inositol 2-dehydrogenase (NADP+)